MNKLVFYSLCIVICCACTRADTEKYQNKRNKVINVHDQVKEIPIEDVMIGPIARLFLIDNYLIIVDYKSDNK
ncbi:MAG: 6-bladed beta-propeller, partial [Dysgonamonadaceae bacterium]|nr:6-bladed beta-propeller [Dysgonamonadaceae bacterium]